MNIDKLHAYAAVADALSAKVSIYDCENVAKQTLTNKAWDALMAAILAELTPCSECPDGGCEACPNA